MADENQPRDDSGQFVSDDTEEAPAANVDEIEEELAAIREQEQPQSDQPGTRESVEQAAEQRTRDRRATQQPQGQPQQPQGQPQGQPQQQRQPQQQQPRQQPQQQQQPQAAQQAAQPQQHIEGAGDGESFVDRPQGQQQPQRQAQQQPRQQQQQQPQQQSGDAYGPAGDFDVQDALPQEDARTVDDNPAHANPQQQQQRQRQRQQQQQQSQSQQPPMQSPDDDYEIWSEVVNQDSSTGSVTIPTSKGEIHFEMHPLPRKVRNKYMRKFPPGLFDAMDKAQETRATEGGEIPQEKQEEIEGEIDKIDMIPTEEGTEALVNTVVESLWHQRLSPSEVRDFVKVWDDSVLMGVALRAIALSSADARVEEFRFD